jgi:quercetin dioxygenase-like cupin family protein
MQLQKFRWSKVYESQEEELLAVLEAQGVVATRWAAHEPSELETHAYSSDTTLWCADGSVTYDFGDQKFVLQPGDGLSIPSNYGFTATVGMFGCAIYEA